MNWKVEVIADSSGKWCGNAAVYPTKEVAEKMALDLAWRWLAVRDWRVVETEAPANWDLVDGKLTEVKA